MKRSLAFAMLALSLSAMLSLGSAPFRPARQTVVPGQRPILLLFTYYTSKDSPTPGSDFTLFFRLGNTGEVKARNIVVTFTPGDFLPRRTGGVVADTAISAGADTGYEQPLTVSPEMQGKSIGSLDMQVSYNDEDGVAYSGSFNLTLRVGRPASPQVGPTRTPTPTLRPLLLIDGYEASTTPLKPGTQFALSLSIRNGGAAEAKDATLVVGGGSSDTPSGTPGSPGGAGVSGAGGNFQIFAPLGSSNVQFLGSVASGVTLHTGLHLIVNNTTAPGAYPLTISLIYTDPAGMTFTDDHVVTLLVYSPPFVEVSFYRPPDVLFAGQPGSLPIQIVNLDRKSVILSRMTVRSEGAELINNQSPIGFLDAGGFFTLDPTLTTFTPGPTEIVVDIDYLDDFNTPQLISQTLIVEVVEAPEPSEGEGGGGGGGGPVFEPAAPETSWQKVMRFVRGLLGLDSGLPEPAVPIVPPEEELPPGVVPVPIVPKG
jgi:hypothetical protein